MNETEYIFCVLIDSYDEGDEFIEWPLHITLVPWFFVPDITEFQLSITEAITYLRPIHVIVGEERVWGPNTVNVIERSEPLHDLHARLLRQTNMSGRIVINQQYTGENYTPHITQQSSLSATPGDKIIIDQFCIIKKTHSHRLKTVIKIFKL